MERQNEAGKLYFCTASSTELKLTDRNFQPSITKFVEIDEMWRWQDSVVLFVQRRAPHVSPQLAIFNKLVTLIYLPTIFDYNKNRLVNILNHLL